MKSSKLRASRSTRRDNRRQYSISSSTSSSSSPSKLPKSPQSFSPGIITPALSSASTTKATTASKFFTSPTLSESTDGTDGNHKKSTSNSTEKFSKVKTLQSQSPQSPEKEYEEQGEAFDRHEEYIQNLTLQLSAKEARRQIQRESLMDCVEEFQKIRKKMKALEGELLVLDDDIESLEKKRTRAYTIAENGDDAFDSTQYAINLTQLDAGGQNGHYAGEGGALDLDNIREDEGSIGDRMPQDFSRLQEPTMKKSSVTAHSAISQDPKFSLSINSDECINEPSVDRGDRGERKNVYDEEEAAAIEDYYADEHFGGQQNETVEGEEENYYIPEEEEDDNDIVVVNNNVPSSSREFRSADVKSSYQINGGNGTAGCFTPTLSYSTTDNVHTAAPPAGLVRTSSRSASSSAPSSQMRRINDPTTYSATSSRLQNGPISTIDQYFTKPVSSPSSSANTLQQNTTLPATSASSLSIFPPSLQQRYSTMDNNNINNNNNNLQRHTGYSGTNDKASYPQDMGSENFPWSNHLREQLHTTFKIRTFRDHQKEIMNCTMSGNDVFVIMRTGGGKSLTYQLPALLEGCLSPARKITLVVSPLLSLIRDQEDQMNSFWSGSATSFTSNMTGGASERARRWNLVRDPDSGLCIIFVTPEAVHKSNKLRSELEKLNDQGRLGRFVIDECHCACQWGHDFRPDYTKLGILKQHFPNIPLIAVTATASDRVRLDCCRILKIGDHVKFFRSSANRPNLKYSVRVKVDKPDHVIEDMASFIKEHHPHHAGIVYTFSRKEADTVADKLSSYGISARAYHSSVCDSAKESIHRNWMRNKTQVVVATIAFGLGINKADVRFVIHHTLSKSLEAYYQESGRAGRDGGSADCILYYSVKDVSRMIGMIHGENGEGAFWSIVRYSQQHGDDELCRRIILSTLGEPGCASIERVLSQGSNNNTSEEKEVGKHAKTLARLIQWSPKDLTIQQIVTKWRGNDVPKFVKETPPGPDLNKDECERLIAALLLSDILYPKVVFTAYASIVYIGLKEKAALLMSSPNPKVAVRFPIRKAAVSKSVKTNAQKTVQNENGWLSKKQSTTKKTPKSTAKKKKTKTKTPAARKTSKIVSTRSGESKKSRRASFQDSEVINILDDSDDEPLSSRKRPARASTSVKPKRIRTNIDIFEDSCSENEFNE